MHTITLTKAQSDFNSLIDETANSHEPIHITGKNSHAVLLSEDDWRAVQETLYLSSIPKMRDILKKGKKIPLEKCEAELTW